MVSFGLYRLSELRIANEEINRIRDGALEQTAEVADNDVVLGKMDLADIRQIPVNQQAKQQLLDLAKEFEALAEGVEQGAVLNCPPVRAAGLAAGLAWSAGQA